MTTLAFDRSARSVDTDGKLHVAVSHITKATVNPYYGREIPDAEALRLKPDTIYMLLRDPEELERAAPTANNLPLQDEHIAFLAADPPIENIVGSTGTDAVFNKPYLDNSLVIWVQEAIDDIEAREKCELSCSYRYRADMTPGVYEGTRYDGVMRDIVFNHVALVREGRAGHDVIVGDSRGTTMALKSRRAIMLQGALAASVRPFLASDARIDFAPVLGDITDKNFKAKKATIAERMTAAVKDKVTAAFDANAIALALDAAEKEDCADDAEMDPDADDKKKARDKRAKDRKRAMDAMRAKDGDGEETDAEREAREESDKAEDARRARDGEPDETDEEREARYSKDRKAARDKKAKDGEPEKVDKTAMDAAIKRASDETRAATLRQIREANEARALVEPHIGTSSAILAMDSAEDILKLALDGADGVELDGTESLSALKSMVKMLRPPSEMPAPTLAMDRAGGDKLNAMFPTLALIGRG